MNKLTLGAGLTLALVACGSSSTPTAPKDGSPVTGAGKSSCLGTQSPNSLAVSPLAAVTVGTPALNWDAPHVAGTVLVVPNDTITAQSLTALSAFKVQSLNAHLLRVTAPAGTTERQLAAELRSSGLTAQPDFIYQKLSSTNDPGFPGNSGLQVDGVTANQFYLTATRVPTAWDTLKTCGLNPEGVSTAFIDTNIDSSHPDLQGKVAAHVSFLASGETSAATHGTATAGIFAAISNNNLGLSGMTSGTPVISEEALNDTGATTSGIAAALNDAVSRGAKVINLSLGMVGNPGDAVLDSALNNAAKSAILVAAAGNTSTDGVYYPASNANVIAVGATGADSGTLACYSARPNDLAARRLDIVAPGGNGYGVCQGAVPEGDLLLLAPNNSYTLEAGTSFAAPQVSSVVSLMWAANPKLKAAQVKSLLLGSVNSSSGEPLLDADAAIRAAIAAP